MNCIQYFILLFIVDFYALRFIYLSIYLFIYLFINPQAVTIQGSQITEFDRTASNGVIHVIDTVMLPPTGDIVDYVANATELSTLYSLVGQAGIASALKGKLSFFSRNISMSQLSVLSKLGHDS